MYYSNRFSQLGNDIQKTWNLLKSDQLVIADKFNDYFVNIGPNLAKRIPTV